MHDPDQQGAQRVEQSELGNRGSQPFGFAQRTSMMLLVGLMRMPVIVHMGIVLVKVGVLARDVGMPRRKSFAEPPRNSRKVQHAEKNQHQANRKFHG